MLDYTFRMVADEFGHESVVTTVSPPYQVLFELAEIPHIPDLIKVLKEVLRGEREKYKFGWHRCGCCGRQEITEINDWFAEDFGSKPFMTAPTLEVVKFLEEFVAFEANCNIRSRKG